ncbi:MAG: GH92 family glycosyl hydrolase [Oscillospiraceae bacterium]|jgi:predicted alpha-1,2-mannosidase|nr:GH92 family glycosyl hydrolase [Oscillospiraceae bacterium]
MWEIIKKIQGVFYSIILFFTSLFTTGELPKTVTMPDTKPGEYGQWVDPFIGTGGIPWASAMLFPGSTSPYGMVRLSPDTTMLGGNEPFNFGNAGYHYDQSYTLGFSHTRLSGTGAKDMGHFRVTPAIGDTNAANRLSKPLYFTHDNEVATAGYYAVNLPSINCLAELTTTAHTGVHRYTFDTKKDAHLFLDATSFLGDGHATEGKVSVLENKTEVEGEGRVFTTFTSRYDGLKGYFVARFNKPVASYKTWDNNGTDTGVDLNFGSIKNQPLELKIGISFVSIENARENLEAETGGLDFEGVRDLTRADWDSWLSRIDIETVDDDIKTIFYTAMYHSMIMPTDFTDANGEYLGFEGQIGVADGFTYRTDLSLWDTFRTAHPLYALIAPEIQLDSVKSLIAMADIGGTLPRWPSGGGYTGSMLGTPADMVITESYLKGITDFNVEKAYSYMKSASENQSPIGKDGRKFGDLYNQYGYVPANLAEKSVAHTLEYAWADGSISLLADALGYTDEAAYYKEKSLNYKNIFNTETQYFQGKNSDGSWLTPLMPDVTTYYDEISPVKVAQAYVEGSARQWRWTAPQDRQGLVDLFQSKEYFVSELDRFMKDASPTRAALNPGSGYWQGNQHDIHMPYLFNDAGRPDLTQKWVRWALAERHSTDVDGLDGNDDGGTLSSWYIFSAMGLYPVAGTDGYWIGSPNLDKAVVDLQNGSTLTIIAENQSAGNIYVQSAVLNGEPLTEPYVTHAQLAGGGTLVFTMGGTPAANGGF